MDHGHVYHVLVKDNAGEWSTLGLNASKDGAMARVANFSDDDIHWKVKVDTEQKFHAEGWGGCPEEEELFQITWEEVGP